MLVLLNMDEQDDGGLLLENKGVIWNTEIPTLLDVDRPAVRSRARERGASFHGRFRDELLTTEQFDTLREAQVLAEDWRIEYHTYGPHGSLGDLTPEAFRQQWNHTQPALS